MGTGRFKRAPNRGESCQRMIAGDIRLLVGIWSASLCLISEKTSDIEHHETHLLSDCLGP